MALLGLLFWVMWYCLSLLLGAFLGFLTWQTVKNVLRGDIDGDWLSGRIVVFVSWLLFHVAINKARNRNPFDPLKVAFVLVFVAGLWVVYSFANWLGGEGFW